MKQDIRFKGLNLALDEQAVENGALAVCDGMEMCGGALRPCVIEGVRQTAEINGEILYIHEMTNGRKNAIFAVDNDEGLVIDGVTYPKNSLIYQDLSSTEPKPLMAEDNLTRSIINSVTSNGNTLVMLTTKGIKYFRWYENAYKYLGKMPELEMEFSLKLGEDMAYDFGITHTHYTDTKPYLERVTQIFMKYNNYYVDSSVDYTKSDTLLAREEAMEAALGKAKNACHKAKYFALPFFVRYCYRLWDGRKVMHSAPVLLYSDITYPEVVWVGQNRESHDHWNFGFLLPQQLNVSVRTPDVLNTLKDDWEDIVTSVDVYITPGISRRDENASVVIPEGGDYPWEGKWKHVYYNENGAEHKPSSMTAIDLMIEKMTFGGNQLQGKYAYVFAEETGGAPNRFDHIRDSNYKNSYGLFIPKQIDDRQWMERLVNQNAYYLLRRFKLKDGEKPENGVFPINDGILENIEAQEQMITSTAPDDYRTHNEIIAQTSYVYNNRINLTGIQEIPFNGFPIYCLAPHLLSSSGGAIYPISSIIVRLDDNGESVYVKTDYDDMWYSIKGWLMRNTFLFYPDSRAKEMWIYSRGGLEAHFSLEEHPLLNGAYHIGDLSSGSNYSDYTPVTSDTDPRTIFTEDYTPRLLSPNYIFTSASGNPFVFPAAHRYAVGLGSVLAIASTTRALSQGQFGQYPLIAFATDGIYALEISSTGSYSGIQPISREVITNPRSLLQLDQSIAFVTRRAVNQLVSSDVTSLSDMLNGALRDLSEMLKDREGETVIPSTGQVADLIGAMQDAQGIYDFVNSRLLYFLKDGDTFTGDVLVFCANDGAWAYKSLGDDIIKGIYNSYPYPYIHKTDGSIECLSVPYDNMEEGSYSGVVVTRTLKTEGVRNAIREFFQDYDFGADTDRPTLMLWGSNDNRTWHYIGRSNARQMGRLPGRIYRYFRLAVKFENMKRNDLYHGVQLDVVERFTR